MWKKLALLLIAINLAGCNMAAISTETATPSPTDTATASATIAPSATHTATNTPTASYTPTVTHTATVTLTPSITPTASITPVAEVFFRTDQLALVDIPEIIRDGIDNPLIVFANSNNQQSITNIATGEPANSQQIIYVTAPGTQNRTAILELFASEGNRFYPEASGKALAYFTPSGSAAGLYLLNIISEANFSARIWTSNSLVQQGIFSEPVWTSDGEQLAVTLQTPYALDIYLYSRDGSERINLTDAPSYDMWPSFSPDGRYMAFVSDRLSCPSWNPADSDFCDALTTEAPLGGTVHLMDLETREVRPIGDMYVTEPPRWINNNSLVIAAGDQNNLLNPQRVLWLADVYSNQTRKVQLAGDDDSVLYLSDTWSPDGNTLVFQRATVNETEVVMMTVDGQIIRRRSEDLTFPRFGLDMSWSPIGERIAFGGIGGRCPYGVRVADAEFDWVASGNLPSMCHPIYSPDGASLVFTGVTSEVDGRFDIYSASANGFGQVNITGDLRGTNTLIGWIGG